MFGGAIGVGFSNGGGPPPYFDPMLRLVKVVSFLTSVSNGSSIHFSTIVTYLVRTCH